MRAYTDQQSVFFSILNSRKNKHNYRMRYHVYNARGAPPSPAGRLLRREDAVMIDPLPEINHRPWVARCSTSACAYNNAYNTTTII